MYHHNGYCFVQDNDCHWYYIPFDKKREWYDLLDGLDDDCPIPEWATIFDGPHRAVIFEFKLL